MASPSVQEIVDDFTAKVAAQLDESKLDGPVRLDPTRSIVIIPLKDKGPIHAYTNHHIDDEGVQNVIQQIRTVPSLKELVQEPT
jgi:hypothetical protein